MATTDTLTVMRSTQIARELDVGTAVVWMWRTLATSVLLAVGVSTEPAMAANEYWLDLQAGALESDNIRRTQPGESSAAAVIASTGSFRATESTVSVDLEGAFTYRDFVESEFGSDFLPQLRARFAWEPGPDNFRLVAENNLGQISLRPAEGLQPQDRESLNVATLGPDLLLEISSAVRALGQLRYTHVNFGDSDIDSSRLVANAEVAREVAGGGEATLSALAGQTDFRRSDLRSYQIQSITAGYRIDARRTFLQVDGGIASAKNQGLSAQTGFNGAVSIARRLSDRSTAFISATRRFGDSADAFQIAQNLQNFVGETLNVSASAALESQTGVSVGYEFQARRLGASLQALQFKQAPIEDLAPDRQTRALNVRLRYAIRPTLSVGFAGGLIEDRSNSPLFAGDDTYLSASIQWRILGRVGVQLIGEHFSRDGSPIDFDELRTSLLFSWAVVDQRTARPGVDERWNVRRLRSGI
jgi:hypothetical protein